MYYLVLIAHSLSYLPFLPSHLQISTILMSNYLKQVLGYKSTEQPDDAMEKGRIASVWSPSSATGTLQPVVAAIGGGSTALPSISFEEPSPSSYTTSPWVISTLPPTCTNMEADRGPHGLRRCSEEPATPTKVRVVQSNSPLGHSVSLAMFISMLY